MVVTCGGGVWVVLRDYGVSDDEYILGKTIETSEQFPGTTIRLFQSQTGRKNLLELIVRKYVC